MSTEEITDRLKGRPVVLDLASPYLIVGTFVGENGHYILLEDADVHDLRDTRSTRDQYLAVMKTAGLKPNRKRTFIAREQVVSLAALEDVVG
jgi:hypothetical protein